MESFHTPRPGPLDECPELLLLLLLLLAPLPRPWEPPPRGGAGERCMMGVFYPFFLSFLPSFYENVCMGSSDAATPSSAMDC